MTKLRVGNLSAEVTEGELREAFGAYGPVIAVEFVRDPESGGAAGVAYIAMMWQAHALAAMQALDGTHMKGRSIDVSRAPLGGVQNGWEAVERAS